MKDVHILLVDDQPQARAALTTLLSGKGYHVSSAENAAAAVVALARRPFDLMIAEAGPGGPGGPQPWDLLENLAEPPALIVLTGRPSLESAIGAVNARAAGYLLKPCAPATLLASVEAALGRHAQDRHYAHLLHELRRQVGTAMELLNALMAEESEAGGAGGHEEGMLRVGGLLVGANRRAVAVGGEPLPLTPIEHKLLRCLGEANGQLQGYAVLAEQIYGYRASEKEAAALLKSHARNLRRKLPPGYLVTVRNAGYLLVDPTRAPEAASPEHFLEVGGVRLAMQEPVAVS